MADAFQYFFNVIHESVMKHGLKQFYMAKMSWTFPLLTTCQTRKLHRIDAQPQIIWASSHWPIPLVEFRLSDLSNRPVLQFCLWKGAESNKPHLCRLASWLSKQIAWLLHLIMLIVLVDSYISISTEIDSLYYYRLSRNKYSWFETIYKIL